MRNPHIRLAVLTVVMFFIGCSPALACQGKSFTWDPNDPSHPGDGTSWNDQNNWEPHDQGVPGANDTVSISGAGATWSEAEINGAADVCSMSIDAGTGPVFITTGGNSIDVSESLSMSGGSNPDVATITGGVTTPLALVSGDTEISSGTLKATVLTMNGHLDLADATLEDDATGEVSGTIASDQSSEGDDNSKLLVNGSLTLTGDLTASQLDLNLSPTSTLDLAGHTVELPGVSFSRWQGGTQVSSSSSGGTLDFTNRAKLLIDGTVSIGQDVNVKVADTATFADGTWFGGGHPGVLKGSGQLEWLNGTEAGSVTLAPGFHALLDGGGTRDVSNDNTIPIGEFINRGDLTVSDGQLNVDGAPAQVVNSGTMTVKPGVVLGNSSTSALPSFDNAPGATFAVQQVPGSFPPPTVTIDVGSITNSGTLQIPFGEELLLQNGSGSSDLAHGGTLAGGGIMKVGQQDTLNVVGTTTLTDGTVLWLDGMNAVVHGGAFTKAGTFPGDLTAAPQPSGGQPGGTFRWQNGTVEGVVTTQHDLHTDVVPGSAHQLVPPPDHPTTLLTLSSATTITGTAIALADSAGVALSGSVSASGRNAGFTSTQTPNATQEVTIKPGGSFTAGGGSSRALLNVPLKNAGAINLRAGTLRTGFGYTQSGGGSTTLARGTTLISEDGASNPHRVILNGGTLLGAGRIEGELDNQGGTVRPTTGGGPGTLVLSGDYRQGSSGTLAIPVDGKRSGQFGVLRVSGDVSLAGGLALNPSASYVTSAKPGDTLAVLPFGGNRKGVFGSLAVIPSLSHQRRFVVSYRGSSVDAVVANPHR